MKIIRHSQALMTSVIQVIALGIRFVPLNVTFPSLREMGREESEGIVRYLKTSLGVSKCLESVYWLRILKFSIGLTWRLIEINTGFSADSFLLACV